MEGDLRSSEREQVVVEREDNTSLVPPFPSFFFGFLAKGCSGEYEQTEQVQPEKDIPAVLGREEGKQDQGGQHPLYLHLLRRERDNREKGTTQKASPRYT